VKLARELARAASARDAAAVAACFASGAELRWGDQRVPASELLGILAGAPLVVEGVVAGGWSVACRFRVDGAPPVAGVAILEAAPGERRFRSARFLVDPAPRS
jgi:hypothetical protein